MIFVQSMKLSQKLLVGTPAHNTFKQGDISLGPAFAVQEYLNLHVAAS
jgi:hypothetical protein